MVNVTNGGMILLWFYVRSGKDRYSVQALIENNDIEAKKLMEMVD